MSLAVLPDEATEAIKGMVAALRQQFFGRATDYFECTIGNGNEILACERGSNLWQRCNDIWCGDGNGETEVTTNRWGVVDIWEFGDIIGPYWCDHLTGEREATGEYPGWYFETFRDRIVNQAHEIVAKYLADEGERWADCLDIAEDTVARLLGCHHV